MGNIVEESRKGNLEGVRALLDNGADIDTLDADHDTALTWAAYSGHTDIVRLLIDRGADITIPNKGGSTPLQLAQGYNRPAAAALLENAAQRSCESWKEMGASSVAHVGQYPDIDQKLTTIFNFKSRDRVIIAKSISGNMQSVGPATSFDTLPRPLIEEALEQFTRFGGKADRDYVFSGISSMNKPKLKSPSA